MADEDTTSAVAVVMEPDDDFTLRIVEVFGVEGMLKPTPKILELDADAQPMHVDGLTGWTVAWIAEEESYLMLTFQGAYLSIQRSNLREYQPPAVEEGGFDVAWPPVGVEPNHGGLLGDIMARQLYEKDYCVLQMSYSEEQRRNAMGVVRSHQDWECVIPEFERKFMGRGVNGKVSFIGSDPEEGELAALDGMLMNVHNILSQYTPALGFLTGGRSKAIIRAPFENPAEQRLLARGVQETDLASAEDIEHLMDFSKRARICMLFVLVSNGGTVVLDSVDPDQPSIEIPFQQGRLLLINDDVIKYSLRPAGAHLVVQAWLMREALPGEVLDDHPQVTAFDATRIPKCPAYGESGELVAVTSFATVLPGSAHTPDEGWGMFCSGCDAAIVVPSSRWDIDFYWGEEPGKMYMRHFGMMNEDEFMFFDNRFFSIDDTVSYNTCPPARKLVEVGYDCLARAGWSLKTLRNTEMVTAVGGSVSDFESPLFGGGWDIKPIGDAFCYASLPWMGCAMAHYLQLKGPSYVCDTACSSALTACATVHTNMRPLEPGQMQSSGHRQCKVGLGTGQNLITEPAFTIGLCGAHMLSHMGRCFTFDASGDGFSRGEGVGAMHFQVETSENLARMAVLAGSNMNQDGRSASLTAPYGPSQIACTWGSLREVGISPFDITIQELHGTGTALGDPIEVGALRAVMRDHEGVTREHPLVKTSSKSNLTHTETNAGIVGLIKSVLMVMFGVGQTGIHLRILNPHIDTNKYPVILNSEIVDQGKTTAYSGVSSFGFGGSNARGDVWGVATAGHKRVIDIGKVLDHRRATLFGKARPLPSAGEAGIVQPMQQPDVVKGWSGFFQVGSPMRPGVRFFLSGTWNTWNTMDEMHVDQNGVYSWAFRMGDTLCEEFRIHVDYFADHIIFPGCERAGPEAPIFGPGNAPTGYNWKVDGRKDGAKPGTLYRVRFWWDAAKQEKQIAWEIAPQEVVDLVGDIIVRYDHKYSVRGTWTSSRCLDLQPVVGLDGMYETSVRLGCLGHEEFQFIRDLDENQLIYPAKTTASRHRIPVRGPDNGGKNKFWVIQGDIGELVTLRLRIREGSISVFIISDSRGQTTWTNSDEKYYFVKTWGGDLCVPMEPDRSLGVHSATIRVPHAVEDVGSEWFQILVDEDPNQAIYPEMYAALSGSSAWLGPDDLGSDMYWRIDEQPGAQVLITVDLHQPDRRQAVTWKRAGGYLQNG